jgi:hypothetical protein
MQRGLLCGVAAMAAALAMFTGGAAASGPAPPGKELIDLDCEALGPFTVSVGGCPARRGTSRRRSCE